MGKPRRVSGNMGRSWRPLITVMQALLDKYRQHLIPGAGLILLTLVVFWQTLGFDFLSNWDDYQYVTSNPDIRGFSTGNLIHIFSSAYLGNYAPVHLLSYLLDYQLVGLRPAWFHGVNVFWHSANGLLFYLLVHRLTGKRLWAFASAALFLLHPVQVESVAWVTERKNLLAMFFSLLSFLSYLSYRSRSGEQGHRAYFFSVLFLVLALLSKSIAVIMPVVFLLHDRFQETPPRRSGLLADKVPFFVAAALASGITMYTQSVEMGGGLVDLFEGDTWAKILTMLTVLTRYLQLLFWPSNSILNSVYILYVKSRIDGEVVGALLLALALVGAGIYLWRRERRLFFGFSLFFLGLVPVSQIVPLATLMNDRYLYFPMLGAAWIAGGLVSRCQDRFQLQRINPAHLLIACLIIPCLLLSYQRCAVWRNSIALWSDVAAKYPVFKDQHAALAAAYLYDGQKMKALGTYEKLFAFQRDFSDPQAEQKALLEAAKLYIETGTPARALPLLTSLTTRFPDYPLGLLSLGDYHRRAGNLPRAEEAYRRVLLAKPKSVQALAALGGICLETGRVDEARVFYGKCQQAGGNSPEVQYNLARVEAVAGDHAKALQHLEEALRLGYRNLDAITGNPELAPVRRLAKYDALLAAFFPAPGK